MSILLFGGAIFKEVAAPVQFQSAGKDGKLSQRANFWEVETYTLHHA